MMMYLINSTEQGSAGVSNRLYGTKLAAISLTYRNNLSQHSKRYKVPRSLSILMSKCGVYNHYVSALVTKLRVFHFSSGSTDEVSMDVSHYEE